MLWDFLYLAKGSGLIEFLEPVFRMITKFIFRRDDDEGTGSNFLFIIGVILAFFVLWFAYKRLVNQSKKD